MSSSAGSPGAFFLAVAVGLDDDVDVVGVVEAGGCGGELSVGELVVGAPERPEQAGDVGAVGGEAVNAALGVEVPLVPLAQLALGAGRGVGLRDVLHVVAAAGHQAGDAFGPKGSDDAAGPAAPVVARQGGALDAQGVEHVTQVGAEGCLLAGAWRLGAEEARGAVAAQVRDDDAVAGLGKRAYAGVVGSHVVGEAVHEEHGRSVVRAVRFVGDCQGWGVDYRHEADFRPHPACRHPSPHCGEGLGSTVVR